MPEATLSISEGLSVGVQESLAEGRLDIALLYNAMPAGGVELTPLLEDPLFLVQRHRRSGSGINAKLRPVSLAEVAALPLVIPSRPNAIRMMVGTRPWPRRSLSNRRRGGNPDLVADGAGSAILSRNAVVTLARPQAFAIRSPGSAPRRGGFRA